VNTLGICYLPKVLRWPHKKAKLLRCPNLVKVKDIQSLYRVRNFYLTSYTNISWIAVPPRRPYMKGYPLDNFKDEEFSLCGHLKRFTFAPVLPTGSRIQKSPSKNRCSDYALFAAVTLHLRPSDGGAPRLPSIPTFQVGGSNTMLMIKEVIAIYEPSKNGDTISRFRTPINVSLITGTFKYFSRQKISSDVKHNGQNDSPESI